MDRCFSVVISSKTMTHMLIGKLKCCPTVTATYRQRRKVGEFCQETKRKISRHIGKSKFDLPNLIFSTFPLSAHLILGRSDIQETNKKSVLHQTAQRYISEPDRH